MKHYLVVPGLLGPLPKGEAGQVQIPRLPNLERLLARAEQLPSPSGLEKNLFDLFGLQLPDKRDLPSAAVCYHAEPDLQALPDTYLLHADPLHLRADQDRLLAYDLSQVPLDEEEAQEVADAFNHHFAEDGLRLIVAHPQRWYLSVAKTPSLRTVPLSTVLARNIDLFLPQGEDAPRWMQWSNELQMLLHSLPLNQQREALGQPVVNSIWFSGGGVLPQAPQQGFAQVTGDSDLARALNDLSQSQGEAQLSVDLSLERALCAADVGVWLEGLQALEGRVAELSQGELFLLPCDGQQWHWRAGMRQRWWRRAKPFATRLLG